MNEPIQFDHYYHIYNRGNNYENIFIDDEDCRHFMYLYNIYIDSIADTYAWCLLKNHFHMLLKIKTENDIGYLNSAYSQSDHLEKKWKIYYPQNPYGSFLKKPMPSQQFKHFFASYTKYFNEKHKRIGSLFAKNFCRICIKDLGYLTAIIVYIHNNPVKHGFTDHAMDYYWSSYCTIVSKNKTKLKRENVIGFFDDLENFRYVHRKKEEDENIRRFIIEE
jgi:putative transposase